MKLTQVSFSEVIQGVAVGDALGYPLEFMSNPRLSDLQAMVDAKDTLVVSDDTQMTLFLAESLVLGRCLWQGYHQWFQTQTSPAPTDLQAKAETGLMRFTEMYNARAPGNTCMASAAKARSPHENNNSKGNGTVMRCTPIPYYGRSLGWDMDKVVAWAGTDAKVTHDHPFARYASEVCCIIHWLVLEGRTFSEAYREALARSRDYGVSEEFLEHLTAVDTPHGYAAYKRNHGGWVAEEALALAVGSVLHARDFMQMISNAVVIAGDSDTVGAIAGGLAVLNGMPPPPELVSRLDLLKPIAYINTVFP